MQQQKVHNLCMVNHQLENIITSNFDSRKKKNNVILTNYFFLLGNTSNMSDFDGDICSFLGNIQELTSWFALFAQKIRLTQGTLATL